MAKSYFLNHGSWFEGAFKPRLKERYFTTKLALNILFQQKGHNIVETGCTRRNDDYGNGNSSFIYGIFTNMYGGHLTTIDIEPDYIEACKEITKPFSSNITYICEDSLVALPKLTEPINLLYLDSLDVPEGDATVCQMHNLMELKLAEPLLQKGSLVLIDDNDMENGGKSRLTKPYLASKDWVCLLDITQSLWIKN